MSDLINLIWLTHGAALNDAIKAANCGTPDEAEYEYAYLFGRLLSDDRFQDYTQEELQAAIGEAIMDA